jgi:ATP-dependent HslUV protease subunit HslV
VLEPEDAVIGIGSGGNFALPRRAPDAGGRHPAEEVCRRAMKIAGDICVYTNADSRAETLESEARPST